MIASPRTRLAALGTLLLLAGGVAHAQSAKPPGSDAAAVQALAATIDARLAAHWKKNQVQPAPRCDDGEFLRRVYLDLAGRIPSLGEARGFLDDPRPDKRERLVAKLMESPRYATHWTSVWRNLLTPEYRSITIPEFFLGGDSFEQWVRRQLEENRGYDAMVRELLTASVDNRLVVQNDADAVATTREASPIAFYAAKKARPENLAAAATRLFLGVRMECAQCHDHPFAKWKREQFWTQAAFFAGLERQKVPGRPGVKEVQENLTKRDVAVPDTNKVVRALFLDGSEPAWQDGRSGRQTLADWITSPKNPYFARATVNRLWAYFLGTGLLEPVDEMIGTETVDNDPGGLLEEIAAAFVAQKHDLKFLMRAITATRAYQLTSAKTHPSQDNPGLFARMAIRGLTAEQIFDSLAELNGDREGVTRGPQPLVLGAGPPAVSRRNRVDFLHRFASLSERPVEAQTSIPQALAFMNGDVAVDATSLKRSRLLKGLLDFPLLDTAGRVDALYLATLSRLPTPAERQRMLKHVGQPTADRQQAYAMALADVLWVLLNSAEFKVNH
jgi:hypothetical protein